MRFHIILIGIFLPAFLFAQNNNVIFNRYGAETRLSHLSINSITQDNTGYIWVATPNGINRFNGYEFTSFGYGGDPDIAFQSNSINHIFKDSQGMLWIATAEGLNRFNPLTNTLIPLEPQDTIIQKALSQYLFDIIELNATVYVGSNNNLIAYEVNSDDFSLINVPIGTNNVYTLNNLIFDLETYSDSLIYITYPNQIFLYNTITEEFTELISAPVSSQPSFQNTFAINDSILLIGTYNDGLYQLNRNTMKIIAKHNPLKKGKRYLSSYQITTILRDKQFRYWIGTTDGINLLDSSLHFIASYQHDPYQTNSLPGNHIHSLFQDHSGVIWIGDATYGLSTYSEYRHTFYLLRSSPSPTTLSNNYIRGITVDKNNHLWVCTQYGGLNTCDRETYSFQSFQHNPKDPKSIPANRVWDVLEDKKGRLWVASAGGVSLFTRNNQTFYTFPETKNSWAVALCEDKEGNVWSVGMIDAVFKIGDSDQVEKIIFREEILRNANGYLQTIYQDHKGDIWIGGEGLLLRLEDGNQPAKIINYLPDDSIQTYGEQVTSIIENSANELIIGTKGSGIIILDSTRTTKRHILYKDGLPSFNVYGIFEDKNKNYWISSDNGVARLTMDSMYFTNFTPEDGLQSYEFNRRAFYQHTDGTIYFGGIYGLNYFNPDVIFSNPVPPKIVIEEVLVNNKEIIISETNNNKPIQISHDYYNLEVRFASLDYHKVNKHKFRYKLLDEFDDWIYLENTHTIQLSGLDPGEYTLYVDGTNSDGVWSTQPASITLHVQPPWYNIIWIQILFILSFLIIAATLYKLKTYAIKRQNILLKKNIEEKTKELTQINASKDKFFSIISHDLKNPFLGIRNLTDLLENNYDDLTDEKKRHIIKIINDSTNQVFDLLQNILTWSRAQTGNIPFNPRELNIRNEFDEILLLFEPQINSKEIVVLKNLPDGISVYADSNMFQTIFRNILSNAIKFSYKKSTIIIFAESKTESVNISISDQGIGMNKETKKGLFQIDQIVTETGTDNESGTGLGLLITKEFIERHNGLIEVKSEEGKGSIFIIEFPKKK